MAEKPAGKLLPELSPRKAELQHRLPRHKLINGVAFTEREWMVANLIADFETMEAIASRFHVPVNVANGYVTRMHRKMHESQPGVTMDCVPLLASWVWANRRKEEIARFGYSVTTPTKVTL